MSDGTELPCQYLGARRVGDMVGVGGRLCGAAILLLNLVVPMLAHAQVQTDSIIGRVTTPQGAAIAQAVVVVTRAPDRAYKQTTTDSLGAYAVAFDTGSGEYLVYASYPGRQSAKTRVTRARDEPVLHADLVLTEATQELAPVVVKAQRIRASTALEAGPSVGGGERLSDGVVGALSPDEAGDLSAIVAMTPGIMIGTQGARALGLPADQTHTTLNGLAFAGASIPRDVRTRVRLSTSAYDPSRGGFSGAEIAVELPPGSRYTFRRGHATINSPYLQVSSSDPRGFQGGVSALTLSAGADGQLVPDKYYYNAGIQGVRRTQDVRPLFESSAHSYADLGIDADTLARLRSAVVGAGVPLSGAGTEGPRVTETATAMGRVDHSPGSNHTWGVTGYSQLERTSRLDLTPTATSAHSGEANTAVAVVQAVNAVYFGQALLDETKTGLTLARHRERPSIQVPEGQLVLLSSARSPGVALPVTFGGDAGLFRDDRELVWETTNDLVWIGSENRHKIRFSTASRIRAVTDAGVSNAFGTYTFPSIAALAADAPATFVRTLYAPQGRAQQWDGHLAVGDQWRPSDKFQLLYGARLEANRFLDSPASNPTVDSLFGVSTGATPSSLHVSPRIGFTWYYGRHQPEGNSLYSSTVGTFFGGPKWVIRGGIGEFRDVVDTRMLARSSASTGLPGGTQTVECFGDAVPHPDWSLYLQDPRTIPSTCSGTNAGLGAASPEVAFVDRSFSPARSWRANLSWSARIASLDVSVDGILSLNLNQPELLDVNLSEVPAFVLAGEANRPVFAAPADISSSTGAVSSVSARRDRAFGRVVDNVSNARSISRQITFSLVPDHDLLGGVQLVSSYTLSSNRDYVSGFSSPTFEAPSKYSWARGEFDVRHTFLVQVGTPLPRSWSVSLAVRALSGIPFTPVIASDINGDGLANDRALIINPNATSDTTVATSMRALLRTTSRSAANCLRRHMGRVIPRNACDGPWTAWTNLRLTRDAPIPGSAGRLHAAVNIANPLGALDVALHGYRNTRGWGTAEPVDPVLYRVREFDSTNREFRYTVNPGFGTRRGALGLQPERYRVTLDFSMDLGTPIRVQQMRMALDPGRRDHRRARLSAEALKSRYARNVPDFYSVLLEVSDSLLLTRLQVEEINRRAIPYRAKLDSIWTELASEFTSYGDDYDPHAALRRGEAATAAAWELSRMEAHRLKEILAPAQIDLLRGGWIETLISSDRPVTIRMFAPY